MASPPTKRRGISLDPRVDSAVSPDLLSSPQASPPSAGSDRHHTADAAASTDSTAVGGTTAEQISALLHANNDLHLRWQRQSGQLQRQLEMFKRQGDQLALQASQLQALERERRASRRVGNLLMLLLVVAAGALAYQQWPRLQGLTSDWSHARVEARRLTPEIQAMRTQLSSLSTDMDRMGSAIADLQGDVSGVRSDLSAIRSDTGAQQGVPTNTTTMSNPYRNLRPRMPW